VSIPTLGTWMLLGIWLKKFMKNPARQRVFNISMAALLVISIMPVSYDVIRTYLN
jgi:threonine/homoserine/homoserine lactone efflux protein